MLISQETTDMVTTHSLLDIFTTFVLTDDDESKDDTPVATLTEKPPTNNESDGRNLSPDLLEELRFLLSSLMQRVDDLKQKGTLWEGERPL